MGVLSEHEIEFVDVTKIFAKGFLSHKAAVQGVSFSIARREVVGILGANGSGKSTSLKMIMGFLRPTRGQIRICGLEPNDYRSRRLIGYLPENPRFQRFLSACQILNYYGRLADMTSVALTSRVDHLLELVGLNQVRHERVGGFSKGMCQRLAIAQALLHRPRILVFDEPMSGLDPIGRREIRLLIQQIQRSMDVTIVFSSHILSDVEQLCHKVILLRGGMLTRHCSVSDLLSGEPDQYRLVAKAVSNALKDRYSSWLEGGGVDDSTVTFNVSGAQSLADLLGELRTHGVSIVSLASQRKSLEDSLFLPESAGEVVQRSELI